MTMERRPLRGNPAWSIPDAGPDRKITMFADLDSAGRSNEAARGRTDPTMGPVRSEWVFAHRSDESADGGLIPDRRSGVAAPEFRVRHGAKGDWERGTVQPPRLESQALEPPPKHRLQSPSGSGLLTRMRHSDALTQFAIRKRLRSAR
ncbi:hypothetical protein MEX01_17120 [Methylorubrum extorquens]|nr:hypothetical protein MEX01_17120 [Methylorubrum extorquens]